MKLPAPKTVIISEPCKLCGHPVHVEWMNDGSGVVPNKAYLLVADWVYHFECFEFQPEKDA